MTVTLASPWNPRGELSRLQRLLPQLQALYHRLVITLPPQVSHDVVDALKAMDEEKIVVVVTGEWAHGRYSAVRRALDTEADFVHYVDMDRLLRWVETRPEEWQQTVSTVQQHDFLVIGRSKAAWKTHPHALRQTERIANMVFSHLLGKPLDLSAGSKGMRRAVARFIIDHTQPERALGTDSEWVVMAQRGGFEIASLEVDGLDWETADRHQQAAATAEEQQRQATAYDEDAEHWALRVRVALEIVEVGLRALQKPLDEEAES